MPHIRVYGMSQSVVANLSDTLIDVLAEICQAKAESFIIDSINSQSYRRGQTVNDIAQIEVLWFPKDPETHHRAERAIREAVICAYPELKHTVVMFRELTPSTYYKDGKNY